MKPHSIFTLYARDQTSEGQTGETYYGRTSSDGTVSTWCKGADLGTGINELVVSDGTWVLEVDLNAKIGIAGVKTYFLVERNERYCLELVINRNEFRVTPKKL